jgi:hypothetical protein
LELRRRSFHFFEIKNEQANGFSEQISSISPDEIIKSQNNPNYFNLHIDYSSFQKVQDFFNHVFNNSLTLFYVSFTFLNALILLRKKNDKESFFDESTKPF